MSTGSVRGTSTDYVRVRNQEKLRMKRMRVIPRRLSVYLPYFASSSSSPFPSHSHSRAFSFPTFLFKPQSLDHPHFIGSHKAMEPDKGYRRAKANKRQLVELYDDDDGIDTVYRFKVLLPNGTSIGLTVRDIPLTEMPFGDFINLVKNEYFRARKLNESMKQKRKIDWEGDHFYLEDVNGVKIRDSIKLKDFKPHSCHILQLHDGSGVMANTFENMWDLTPDTDLLMELPEEYTFETALADLIDNSLQAVWSNRKNERRLISVNIASNDSISIFDTGPGMDGSDENSIVKWGKMGASLHRSSKGQAIGGKPPYLRPFFGMFGYGGPSASMHLGRRALVSSKTKSSRKVYTLHLEREALLSSSGSELSWKTTGGMRDPSEDELSESPHGSFTKIEIFELKRNSLDIFILQCKIKDIYFPYIQCDEVGNSAKTITPIEFQVNGDDLAEIEGGEVAVTNLHSCNGPDFILQLRFSFKQDSSAAKSPGSTASQEANACLKCVYFPSIKGKESVEMILEKLEAEGCSVTENYETFSRVSVRRLGRLLPDARWARLPFMDFRHKRGDKAHILKRCCWRVKCFIDTDAGFNPTPSKTDLAHHSPFTTALKNFGNKLNEKEKFVDVEIYRDQKLLTPLQLEREYQDWILQMHDRYDQETECGEDQPVLVVSPANKKALGISSDVVRVHKVLKRKGVSWKSGQKIKILKGACAGCHKNNVYAELEYFLLEGFQGDAGVILFLLGTRPLGIPDDNGSIVAFNNGDASFNICGSLSLPINVIDSGKCLAIGSIEWNCQVDKQHLKSHSTIDLLSVKQCQELEIDGALPVDGLVHAGQVPPTEIVAVVRPANFVSSSISKNLDQNSIVKSNLEMSMEIKFREEAEDLRDVCRIYSRRVTPSSHHIYSKRITPSSHKGFHGLYIFPLGSKFPDLFQKAGVYTFSFYIDELTCNNCDKEVLVKASSKVGKWDLLSDELSPPLSVRVGSCLPPFCLTCNDIYGNRIPFTSAPEVMIKLQTIKGVLVDVEKMRIELSPNKFTLKVEDILIESNELDKIRPNYEATLVICSRDKLFSVSFPCQVYPGSLQFVKARPPILDNQQLPGCIIKELVLEVLVICEMYRETTLKSLHGLEVELAVEGFCMQDQIGSKRKVDDNGCIDLSGLLKVTAGYGRKVSLSVLSGHEVVFKQEFQTQKQEMQITSGVSLVQSPKLEYQESQSPYSNEKVMLLVYSSSLKQSEKFIMPLITIEKELEDEVLHIGLRIGNLEKELDFLYDRKAEIELDISHLQASFEPCLPNSPPIKEELINRIQSNNHSAASVLCCLSREFSFQGLKNHFMEDIVGLVALLGTVRLNKLSRILAEYLGEDQMLAVVCRSSAAASALEKFEHDGEVHCRHALHAEAAALGKSIYGRFLIVCLEDIRAYKGEFEGSDPQRKLALPYPTFPSGKVPMGFVGYAVNMIDLDVGHLHTRTAAGHGLRETLFYCLLREVQVYETVECMLEARHCIKHGAVSLDGGILRDNGIISLGFGNPQICFSVTAQESEPSKKFVEIMKLIEENKSELRGVINSIEKLTRSLKKYMKKFKKRKGKYQKLMDDMEPVVKGYLEYKKLCIENTGSSSY